jgi:hypothetical protein
MRGRSQPSPASRRACSGERTTRVSPWWVDLWCEITASECASVISRSSPVRLRWSYTVCGAAPANAVTVLSPGANPCSTENGVHGLSSSFSPMQ